LEQASCVGVDDPRFRLRQDKDIFFRSAQTSSGAHPVFDSVGTMVFMVFYGGGRRPRSDINHYTYTSAPHTPSWLGHGQLDLFFFTAFLQLLMMNFKMRCKV